MVNRWSESRDIRQEIRQQVNVLLSHDGVTAACRNKFDVFTRKPGHHIIYYCSAGFRFNGRFVMRQVSRKPKVKRHNHPQAFLQWQIQYRMASVPFGS